jgi:hypothetical protein
MLIEALVYLGVFAVFISLGSVTLFKCIDNSMSLRYNAEDISSAMRIGELWRADVRAARGGPRLEEANGERTLSLPAARGEVAYRFSGRALFRRAGEGPWVRVLANVKSSTMAAERRSNVTAWRWELELQPRTKGAVKPSRMRPLFTFLAVPVT